MSRWRYMRRPARSADALAGLVLMDELEDAAFERAAVRWVARFAAECPNAGLADMRAAVDAVTRCRAMRRTPHSRSCSHGYRRCGRRGRSLAPRLRAHRPVGVVASRLWRGAGWTALAERRTPTPAAATGRRQARSPGAASPTADRRGA